MENKQMPASQQREIMNKALSLMNKHFSSIDYAKCCRNMGLSMRITSTGECGKFLKTISALGNLKQLSAKQWYKIEEVNINKEEVKKEIINKEDLIKKTIEFLKGEGYKVLKPVSEYVEV